MEDHIDEIQEEAPIFPHALKYGGILGVIHIILALLLYIVDPTMLVGMLYVGLIIAINIGFCIYAGRIFRSTNGGFLGFGKAFGVTFLTLLVNGIIGVVFSLLLYYVIDPSLPDLLTEAQVENSISMAQSFGAPESQIEEMRTEMTEQNKDNYTTTGLGLGFLFAILFYALGGLIVALFIRKNEPIEDY